MTKTCKKSKRRDTDLKRRYNISSEDYNKMVVEQNNKCAICGQTPEDKKKLFVDHNHTTGKIRALLCHHCNTGIGYFKENPLYLQSAMNYLFTHN